ncbi:MAG: trypsin-like peptidase domain-containing protein [Nitrospinaceae bacterium]
MAYTVKIQTRVELPFDGERKGFSTGAGFLINAARGWIMTNAHVVSRSPSHVSAAFHGKSFQPAQKVFVDPYLDMALLKIPPASIPKGVRAASLDCGDLPEIGHSVGAFGHPWKFSFTGTRGIISGVTSKLGGELLQTDAPINPGNSGGPLISMRTGQVVGMNTATLDKDQDQNTNFAEPMKYLCRILTLLKEGRDPSPPDLTIMFQADLEDHRQLIVARTYLGPGQVPIREGDVILEVEGTPGTIHNEGQFVHALRGRLDHVVLKVKREGKEISISGALTPAEWVTQRKGIFFSGILLAPSRYRDRSEMNFPFRVNYVEPGSIGEIKRIKNWDRLMFVDGHPVDSLEDLFDYLKKHQNSRGKIVVQLRDISDLDDRIYNYKDIALEVDRLKFIGR